MGENADGLRRDLAEFERRFIYGDSPAVQPKGIIATLSEYGEGERVMTEQLRPSGCAMTLVEFLRARLNERQERIERLKVERWQLDGGHIFGVTSADEIVWVGDHDELGAYLAADCSPETALAKVEAKRRIVDACADISETAGPYACALAADVLAALGLLFAGHPDYNPAWRP